MRQPPRHVLGERVRHPDSVGVLMPGVDARLVREDGSDAGYNEPAELLLCTRGTALGYLGNEKATKETFLGDGWVKTGDVMKVDENGRFL